MYLHFLLLPLFIDAYWWGTFHRFSSLGSEDELTGANPFDVTQILDMFGTDYIIMINLF